MLCPHFYKTTFSKLDYKDYTFFKFFIQNQNIKPADQKEFIELKQEFITNYKKDYKLKTINFDIKKKIRVIICTILTVMFLRSIDLTKLKYYQLAQHLEYLIN